MPITARPTRRLVLLASLLAWLSPVLLGQKVPEVEPNGPQSNTPGDTTAQVLPALPAVVHGNVHPYDDVDRYRLSIPGTGRLYAATVTAAGTIGAQDAPFQDTRLVLSDATGTTLVEQDDDDGTWSYWSSSLAGTGVSAGTYLLAVTRGEEAQGGTYPYDLYVDVRFAPPTPEIEGGQTIVPGTGGEFQGALTPGDVDDYVINVAAGDLLFVSLDLNPERSPAPSLDGRLSLLPLNAEGVNANSPQTAPAGSGLKGDLTDQKPSEALVATMKEAGPVTLRIDGSGSGPYRLNVTVIPRPAESCETYSGLTSPLSAIRGEVASSIAVPTNFRVGRVAVALDLEANNFDDIDVTLESPDGNEVMLLHDIPSDVSRVQLVLDEERGAFPIGMLGVSHGAFVLQSQVGGRLSWFNGQLSRGISGQDSWTLRVHSDSSGLVTLHGWSLTLCPQAVTNCPANTTAVPLLSTDFENDNGGFTVLQGLDWQRGWPTSVPLVGCASGDWCWTTSLFGSYSDGATNVLTSPTVTMPARSVGAVATWSQQYQMENAWFDELYVDAVVDGTARPVFEHLDLFDMWTDEVGEYVPFGGGTRMAAGWGRRQASVPASAGQQLLLRFNLVSDSQINYGGMSFDDVTISACVANAPSADLSLSKTAGTGVAGGTLPFTITVTNQGAVAAANVVVTEQVPAGTSFVSVTGSGWGFSAPAGGSFTASLASLAPGASASFVLTVGIPADITPGTVISNTATVSSSTADSVTSNNTASQAVVIGLTERKYYLAEGATGWFFDFDLAIANPNVVAAPVSITFLKDDGTTVTIPREVPAMSRITIPVETVAGLEQAATSTVVTSTTGLPLVVERSMFWDSSYYGSHGGGAVDGPATRWLFAEGSQGFFDTYVLLANANQSAAKVTVKFLTEWNGVITKEYDLPKTSRLNVVCALIPEVVGTSFSIVVESDLPIIAERAMYFGSPLFNGGHESIGVTSASTRWFHPEGATAPLFDPWILVGNPNDVVANVTLTYLLTSGQVIERQKQIAPNSRLSVAIASEDPLLQRAEMSTVVESDVPVVSERAMYWPTPFTSWAEAHNSFGVTETATRWGLAEGRVGGPHNFATYVLVANPGSAAATVTVTYLRENGLPFLVRTHTVAPTSRFNVVPYDDGLRDEQFGVLIESTQPIAVERAMYNDSAAGAFWAAGTNATAIKLLP